MAWEVGPAMAAAAIRAGHIQRALVRRRSRARVERVGERGAGAAAASAGGSREQSGLHGSGGGGDGDGGDDDEVGHVSKEERAVLRTMKRLSGREGVRVSRTGAGFPWRANAESCIEVLLPTAEFDPPGSL